MMLGQQMTSKAHQVSQKSEEMMSDFIVKYAHPQDSGRPELPNSMDSNYKTRLENTREIYRRKTTMKHSTKRSEEPIFYAESYVGAQRSQSPSPQRGQPPPTAAFPSQAQLIHQNTKYEKMMRQEGHSTVMALTKPLFAQNKSNDVDMNRTVQSDLPATVSNDPTHTKMPSDSSDRIN